MIDYRRMGALLAGRREGYCLPQALYNDADVFDFDMDAIYGTGWLMAGFTCELPSPGSYVSQMFGKWPVLIVRDKQGVIRMKQIGPVTPEVLRDEILPLVRKLGAGQAPAAALSVGVAGA